MNNYAVTVKLEKIAMQLRDLLQIPDDYIINYEYLESLTVPSLSKTKPAYLLVFEDYELDDRIPNSTKSIIYAIDNLLG